VSGSLEAHDGVLLARWGAGGLGLRLAGGDGGSWVAREEKPLLLLRRDGDDRRAERFAFDAVESRGGTLSGRASVVDAEGSRWEIELSAGPGAGGGFTGRLRWTLAAGAAAGVFVGHCLSLLADRHDLYVCFPGNVYDGNDGDPDVKDIPRVSRRGFLEVPTTSLASPCAAFHARSSGITFVLATAQRAAASGAASFPTGLVYDACDPTRAFAAVTAPLFRSERYHLRNREGEFRFHFVPEPTPGATLAVGDWIDLPLAWFCGVDLDLAAFFRRLHLLRPFFRGAHRRRRVLPLSEACSLVAYNQNRYHWTQNAFYANATEVDGRNATQLLTGWCSGIVTGYGLLGCGDGPTRERAAKMIDFICSTGVSPSGLFYGLWQDGRWDPGRAVRRGEDAAPWRHIRTAEDGTFYLLRAYALETRHGNTHPAWLSAARANLDAFMRLWERYGEFGMEVDRLTGEMTVRGSAAGALCIACLAEGSALLGEPAYLDAAREAAESYYERFTVTGHTNGGPLDIRKAPDSESCLMFPPSFASVWEKTGEARFLQFAVDAADQLASWVMAYDGVFPHGSTLDRHGIQTTGGVIASAQNHHIGPGGATTSFSSLLAIYRATGEERFLRLLEDCATGLPQYLSRHDGHIDRLARGMMTEQINLTDALNHEQGEIWNISASWGATNILLTRLELPGVYVDVERRRCAAFDHVEAAVDWARQRLEIRNTTGFAAEITILIDGVGTRECSLRPDESATVALKGETE
jgi:hypothetical protein